jgi:hypothetical protein
MFPLDGILRICSNGILLSNPNRSQTSLNGSSQDEKVSAVNNALRHVIFGVNYFKKSGKF